MGFERMELKRNLSTEHHSLVSYRDVWFMNARPVIVRLITSGNSEERASACQLITAWMDRCYTLYRFGFDKATNNPRKLMNEYKTKDIVCFFFGEELEFNDSRTGEGDNLIEVFNSLKHDGCLRAGYRFSDVSHFVYGPKDPIPKRNRQNRQIPCINVDSEEWVFTPLVRIDELFMDAIILNEE